MKDLKTRITENGIDYVLVGDYYIPDLKLPEEKRSIGKWGRMHREYLKKQCYGKIFQFTADRKTLELSGGFGRTSGGTVYVYC